MTQHPLSKQGIRISTRRDRILGILMPWLRTTISGQPSGGANAPGRAELTVRDPGKPGPVASGIPEWVRSHRRVLLQCELCGDPAVCEHHDSGNGRDELLCTQHLNTASSRIAAREAGR